MLQTINYATACYALWKPLCGQWGSFRKRKGFFGWQEGFPNYFPSAPVHCVPSYGVNTIQCAFAQHWVCRVRKSSDFLWFSLDLRARDSDRKGKSESKSCWRASKEKRNNFWALASNPAHVWAWPTCLGPELKEKPGLLATCLCWFGFEMKVRTWFPLLGSWARNIGERWG